MYNAIAQHVADTGQHAFSRTLGGRVTIYFGPMPYVGDEPDIDIPSDAMEVGGEAHPRYSGDHQHYHGVYVEDDFDDWLPPGPYIEYDSDEYHDMHRDDDSMDSG